MAISLRELFLIIRAEDHASRTLRTVSGSLRGLARATDIAEQSTRMHNRAAEMQRQIAQRETRMGQFGRRAQLARERQAMLDMQAARANQNLSRFMDDRIQAEERLRAANAAGREEAIKNINTLDKNGKQLRGVTRATRIAAETKLIDTEHTAALSNAMSKLDEDQYKLNTSAMRANHALAEQQFRVENLGAAHEAESASLRVARDNLDEYNKQIKEFDRIAPRMARAQRMQNIGRGLAGAGRAAMFAGGVGAVGVGFAAVRAADLETKSTLAATQAVTKLTQVAPKAQAVMDGILHQMRQFPASADEMAQSIYEIFSGTNIQSTQKGLRLMALFNRAAVAGQSDLNTATQGGLTVMNAYGKSVNDMPRIMNKMFAAVRFGRTNFTDFNNSLNQLVPAFVAAHQSVDTMFGSLAFLTRRMPSVRQASVSLARATEILGNTKMIHGLQKVGVQIADVRGNLLPLPVVFDRILQKFPSLAKGKQVMNWIKDLSNQQGTIQGRRALVHIFQDFPAYHRMLQQVAGDTDEFNRSWQAMKDTPGVKLNVAINKLHESFLEFGRAAIPGILKILGPVQSLGDAFHNLSPEMKTGIATVTVFGSAIALVGGAITVFIGNIITAVGVIKELYITSSVAGMMGNLAAGIRLVSGALAAGKIGAAAGLAAEGMAALAGPAAIGALIVAAGIVTYKILTAESTIDKFADAAHEAADKVRELDDRINGLADSLNRLPGNLGRAVTARGELLDVNKQIRAARGQRAMATTPQARTAADAQINSLLQQRADIIGEIQNATQDANNNFKAFAGSIALFNRRTARLQGLRAQLHDARTELAGLGRSGRKSAEDLTKMDQLRGTIKGLRTEIKPLNQDAQKLGTTIRNKLGKALTDLGRRGIVPKLDPRQMNLAIRQILAHPPRNLRQLKMDIRAVLHPGEASKQADRLGKKLQHDFPQGKPTIKPKMHNAGVYKSAKDMMAHITGIAADSSPVGVALAAGIAGGITAGSPAIVSAATSAVYDALNAARTAIGARSPSKVAEEKIGKPFIQGITKGMLKEAGGVKAAMKSITDMMASEWTSLHDTMAGHLTLFGGPRGDIISSIMGFGAKPGIGLLTQDIRAQTHKFNQWIHAVDRLRTMGAPPVLVQQLWEMGPDGLPAVQSILAGTKRQRKTYFGLFRRQQRLITSGTQRAFLNETRIWHNMGRRAAFGLLTGLHDVRPELVRFFKQIAHEMFPVHHRRHHGGGGGGGQKHVHYHYHAPAHVTGTSHRAAIRKSRFDYERHIRGLPA